MPRARPDTTTSPASPNSRARAAANLRASAEALRAPTMAIMSRREKRTQHGYQRRWRRQRRQAFRKIRIAGKDQTPACFFQRIQLVRCVFFVAAHESLAAATAGETRQFFQRRRGAAETSDQLREGGGPYFRRARQP